MANFTDTYTDTIVKAANNRRLKAAKAAVDPSVGPGVALVAVSIAGDSVITLFREDKHWRISEQVLIVKHDKGCDFPC